MAQQHNKIKMDAIQKATALAVLELTPQKLLCVEVVLLPMAIVALAQIVSENTPAAVRLE